MHITWKTIKMEQCLHHAAHASHSPHAAHTTHASSTSSSISLLRDLGNHTLSCAKERSHSSSICESSSDHLNRVNDTSISHVDHDLVSSIKSLIGISTFLHLVANYGSIESSVCGNLKQGPCPC